MSDSIRRRAGSLNAEKICERSFASASVSTDPDKGLQQITTSSSIEMLFRWATKSTLVLTVINVTATVHIDVHQSMEVAMSRLQLALNVSDLEEAVTFYSKFFKTEPAKIRPGYANFAIAEPPLKLVLFENPAVAGTINHLGVEVFSTDEVLNATKYLAAQGFPTQSEDGTVCCHALQDKVWVDGPDDSRWEVYTVLADATENDAHDETVCCSIEVEDAGPRTSTCC
jgi:lactoylglutathione lyase